VSPYVSSVGTIAVDGADLDTSVNTTTNRFLGAGAGFGRLQLKLTNGAAYAPYDQSCAAMFAGIGCDATSSVCGAGATPFALTTGDWSGAGTVTNVASLTVTNVLAAGAADLLAGNHMSAFCPLTLAGTSKLRVDDPDGLFAALERRSGRYVCAESTESLAGCPSKDRSGDFTNWRVGTTATTLYIDTYPGTVLIFR